MAPPPPIRANPSRNRRYPRRARDTYWIADHEHIHAIHRHRNHLPRSLHDSITGALEQADGGATFRCDSWVRPEGGGGESRVLRDGKIFEQAGINFSHVMGGKLPASATAQRPELAGASFEATGVSLVIHPRNPYVPTSHANVRYFVAIKDGEPAAWWFGGGFDLTPYYPFEEDVLQWHRAAKAACDPFGPEVYAKYKTGATAISS